MGAVTVFKTGEETVEHTFEAETANLSELLEGTDLEGYEVAVNGEVVDLDQEEPVIVKDGDKVILTGNYEGGL